MGNRVTFSSRTKLDLLFYFTPLRVWWQPLCGQLRRREHAASAFVNRTALERNILRVLAVTVIAVLGAIQQNKAVGIDVEAWLRRATLVDPR